jgi:hypothetical protein
VDEFLRASVPASERASACPVSAIPRGASVTSVDSPRPEVDTAQADDMIVLIIRYPSSVSTQSPNVAAAAAAAAAAHEAADHADPLCITS